MPVAAEFRLRHADGTWRTIEAVGQNLLSDPSVGAIIANYRDITERKRAEERALQAERLAAIGQMVTGLAHESRNALQRGQAYLEMLALEVGDRPRAMELIGRQQQALDDLHRLYEEVRNYAAPIRLGARTCDLPALWRLAWDRPGAVRARPRGRAPRGDRVLGPRAAWPIRIRMGQVFRNLLENALAACPDPVEIAIRCAPVRPGRPARRARGRAATTARGSARTAPEGLRAVLHDQDERDGPGPGHRRRVVEAHGGRIEAGDRGTGAEFVITLPREVT